MKTHKYESKEEWLKLRTQVITSTEVSALFNMNPYITEFELWHQKKNEEIVILEDHERMRWGNRLEPAIAEGVAEDNDGWMVHPFKEFATMESLKAGSSFDYLLAVPGDGKMIEGLLEIKNVDWLQIKNKWVIEDGKVIEAPAHIELQVQHQLMVTGYPFCYIAALEGGNKVHLLKREPQEKIISAIKSKVIKFWNSIENGLEPQPDWERDSAFIIKMNTFSEPGKIMDVAPERVDELAQEYNIIGKEISALEKKKKAIKAEILENIGESEKVLGGDYTISAGMVGPKLVEAHERAGFRQFRISYKKGKDGKS